MKAVEASPSTGRCYGIQRVCRCWAIARSTLYHQKAQKCVETRKKTGPKSPTSDEALLQYVREDIEKSPFQGEGHRKIHARVRKQKHIRVSRGRVLRLMRQERLLSPYRCCNTKAKAHDGRITTDTPNDMWGTDAAKIITSEDGWVWFFGVVEHWNAECMGWHVCKKGDRFAAIEALSKGVRREHGSIDKEAARGLRLRMDHGSQFKSDGFQAQARYWGIKPDFGYVREPETNGVIERFNRTLKEQVIHGRIYRNVEEVRIAIDRFIELYNKEWMLEKLGYLSPLDARQKWSNSHAA